MPDEFLKRWLVQTSEQPITMEMLKTEYDMYRFFRVYKILGRVGPFSEN